MGCTIIRFEQVSKTMPGGSLKGIFYVLYQVQAGNEADQTQQSWKWVRVGEVSGPDPSNMRSKVVRDSALGCKWDRTHHG